MPDKKIVVEVRNLSHLIKRQINHSTAFGKATGVQAMIIDYLYQHRNTDQLFQRDLEAAFSIRRSTATGILQLMEKHGLLVREPVGYDARLKKLVLTQAALDTHQRIDQEIEQIERQLADELTKEELAQFFTILDKMKSNLMEVKPV